MFTNALVGKFFYFTPFYVPELNVGKISAESCYQQNNNLSKYSFNLGDTTATDHKKIDRIETFSGGTWVNKNYNADFGGQWCFIDSFVVDTADNGYAMQRITATDGKTVLATRFCNKGTWGNWDIGATKSDLDSYFKTLNLPSNGTVTYTPTNFCIIIAENFNNMTFSFVHIESAGAWVLPIKENETISISVDDSNRKNLLIKNSNSSSGRIFILNFKS